MSTRCPWSDYTLHRYSSASDCFLQHLYDETYLHIFKNVLYSTDPESGRPLTGTLSGVDDVKLLEFGLNHRVCNVETTINENDVHLLEYRPTSAVDLWTMMRNVYNKWEHLHETNGRLYWPCRSQAVDLIIGDGSDSLRCLQPTRFVKEKYKLAQSLLDLLLVLTSNYFQNLLEAHRNGDQLLEVASQKVRKIECKAMKKALSFFNTFDPDRFEKATKKPEHYGYGCSVKRLVDAVSRSDSHKLPANFLKKLFHFTVSDVFSTHREHVHMLLCTRFLVEDPTHCESWLQLMLAVADNRLQVADAQTRLVTEVKQWKRQYDRDRRVLRSTKIRRLEDGVFQTVGLQNSDAQDGVVDHSTGLHSVGHSNALYVRRDQL